MAEMLSGFSIKAMVTRQNLRLDKIWSVDAGFPMELSGKPDFSGVDEGSAAFLSGIVHAIRPKVVLETGTHRGRSTRAIAEVLATQGGHLYTVDMVDYGLLTEGAIRENEKPHVTQIIGETPSIFSQEPLLSLRGIEMAFLNGAHDEKGVIADLEYVDAHRDGPCFVIVNNAHDVSYPEERAFFLKYTAYPHFVLDTTCGFELIRMG